MSNDIRIRAYLSKDPDLSREGLVKLSFAEGPSQAEQAKDPQAGTIWIEAAFWVKSKDGKENFDAKKAAACKKGDRVDLEGTLKARKPKGGGDRLFFELAYPKFHGVYARQELPGTGGAAAVKPAEDAADPFGIPF